MSGCNKDCINKAAANIQAKFDSVGRVRNERLNRAMEWTELVSGDITKQKKAIYIYGLAIHSATDMFAHVTYDKDGKFISHGDERADNNGAVPSRYECAREMCRQIIAHIKAFKPGSLADYYNVLSSSIYTGEFTMKRLSEYVKQVDNAYYEEHRDVFDRANKD